MFHNGIEELLNLPMIHIVPENGQFKIEKIKKIPSSNLTNNKVFCFDRKIQNGKFEILLGKKTKLRKFRKIFDTLKVSSRLGFNAPIGFERSR